MTKADLIEKMAKDAGITKVAAGKAYESFLDGLQGGLKTRGSKVTLVGFGTFKKVYRKLVKAGILRQVSRLRLREKMP